MEFKIVEFDFGFPLSCFKHCRSIHDSGIASFPIQIMAAVQHFCEILILATLHCAWICFALNGAGGINFIWSRLFL